jgi:outer membrane protein TolC
LRYNLGLVESEHASSDFRADRLRALSALLPQISASARQAFESISYQEIGLKLPPIPGLPALPAAGGGFGYQDVRVAVSQRLFDRELRQRFQARKEDERASAFSVKDARDVVVLAVGTAYFQVVASVARVETAKAQLAAAQEFDRLTADRVKSEVSPEIESLRAQVERQSAEQRVTNVSNQLEIDKLTFGRITGLAIDQDFKLTDEPSPVRFADMTLVVATAEALRGRSDQTQALPGSPRQASKDSRQTSFR